MGEHDDKSLDLRMGRIEGNLDDIRLALWQISEKLDDLKPEAGQVEAASVSERKEKPAAPVFQKLPETEAIAATPAPASPKPSASQTQSFPEFHGAVSTKPVPTLSGKKHQGANPPLFKLPKILFSSKFWFNIIGVALVLLGVVFLYKYSVDQGWVNSRMKVAFGMAIGSILLILGLYLHGKQRFFSQMMVGAGIATMYITGYAAYQVYELIPYAVAVAWMSAVTLTGFALAVQQHEQAQALVATIGGLATPFLMHKGVSSKSDMVIYSCAILAGAAAVYFYKGWRTLLWVSVAGGWLSLLFIYDIDISHYHGLTHNDKLGLQAGVIFAVVAFWALPVIRELLFAHNPVKWPQPYVSSTSEHKKFELVVDRHVHALSISTPFIALFFTRAIWHLTNRGWGWVALGAAALLGLAFVALNSREELRRLAYTQALVDMALFTMALGLIFDGDARFIAIAAEATAMHLVAWKLKDRLMLFIAHGYYVFLGVWLFEKLVEETATGMAVLNSHALSELMFIVAVAGVSFLLEKKELRYPYQLGSYLALLGLFLREFVELQNGQGYVTVAWGVCAVGLLVAGIIWADNNWRAAALVTLFVVVGKLILVDLATVKAIWRILLFIGFGTLFLVLSYFFKSLWQPPVKPDGAKPPGPPPAGKPLGGQKPQDPANV